MAIIDDGGAHLHYAAEEKIMPHVFRCILVLVLFLQFGCAAQRSYRPNMDDALSMSPSCQDAYNPREDNTDKVLRNTPVYATPDWQMVKPYSADDACWSNSWEKHDKYELLFTEFDDAGWQYGEGRNYATQTDYVMRRLNAFLGEEGTAEAQPLNIIVFTHGWHHTAEATDTNVKQFRFLLERAAEIEDQLCASLGKDCDSGNGAHPPGKQPWKKKRKVVGIYVGWRGDSVLGAGLETTSIWDRKLAAENVSLGAIQEFYANLHNFYVSHSCHKRTRRNGDSAKDIGNAPSRQCADVRMLVMGHSFGGLITYRSLATRLISNVAETYQRNREDTSREHYAHSFGDLVVLINPAIEATRFEPLAHAASNRNYPAPDAAHPDRMGQLPIVLVVQSEGDYATRTFFPLFRNVTTIFDDPRNSQERKASTTGLGWSERYLTHTLAFREHGGYACPQDQGKLECEKAWWLEQRKNRYSGFDADTLRFPLDLVIEKAQRTDTDLPRPAYDPIWVVRASKEVVADHSDLLNLQFIRFLRQMYYTVLREDDCVLAKEMATDMDQAKIAAECP